MLPNSRVLRIVLYVVVGILFLGAVTWDAARRFGVNPFEGNTILYWGLVFLVGIYVIARIAMIFERHQKGRGQSNVGRRKNSILSMFSGAVSKDVNRRMDARRERVQRAKQKSMDEEKLENE